jgi:MFS transporter, PAT family, beta-lactamase induction signal transducer AmpG
MPLPPLLSDRRLLVITALGFVSGLPLALSGFTLRQWLTEGHVSLAAIGLTANIGVSYTLKFLWAPALDELRPPLGLARLGQRRGWLLLLQPFLLASMAALALSDAAAAPARAIAAAAAIAVFSATQDIAIDAWRIEAFEPRQQGAALAGYVWGYRVAMLVSGAGVIWAAGHLGWHGALAGVTLLAALGLIPVLLAVEPPAAARAAGDWLHRAVHAVRAPLGDFLLRDGAFVVLAYVALFNLGEAMAGVMLAPFYAHLGFDRAAVAAAVGPFSLAATMTGIAAGGGLVARLGLGRSLILTGFVQMGAMALYVVLSLHPGNHAVLYGTVVTEAFVQGLASAAFLAYLSSLCRIEFAATQYALLSSVAPIASHTVGGLSGFLVQAIGWTWFYAASMAAALPAMLIMLHILRRYPVKEDLS